MNFLELLLSNLIGFVLGIISSFVSWWILFKNLRAKIGFSDAISKVKGISASSESWIYRIKIANLSSREAIDLSISARMCFPRLGVRKNDFLVKLPLSSDGQTKVERFRLKAGKENATLIKIIPNKTEAFNSVRFPHSIHEKVASNSLELEDLFRIHPNTFIELFIFATDNFSGTRSLTISKRYTIDDIKLGYFSYTSLEMSNDRAAREVEATQDDS